MEISDTALDLLADKLWARIAPRLVGQAPAPTAEPIPYKLTVTQFAWCIQRTPKFVRNEVHGSKPLQRHVQGGRPMLIHPQALALFGVDPSLAAARLAQFPSTSEA